MDDDLLRNRKLNTLSWHSYEIRTELNHCKYLGCSAVVSCIVCSDVPHHASGVSFALSCLQPLDIGSLASALG